MSSHPAVPFGMRVRLIGSRLRLAVQLAQREISARYRGSVLGIGWSLLTPLLMLAVFTFVFGTVFKTRWTPPGGSEASHSTADFAVILFAGLSVFQLFADVVTRAPSLVLSNVNYVKKVVFPLAVLPLAALGSALFDTAVRLVVLLVFVVLARGSLPATALLLPLVLAPYILLVLGLTWFLAGLGVYVRDVGQFLGPLVTALMFLSPIFFPSSALPDWLQPYLVLNPIALPVEGTRAVLIWGTAPDWTGLALYSAIAAAIAILGLVWFQKTRKGFADVV
ncbi:Teichoic acid translocation permease protein TagG [Rhodoplanes serenus]|uniref:Transport permease protein n=1 Tax=Rhodoplanes serenus TaxID=200615 RepID=A0A3S5CYN5_9BRAD|nr:Teichoic acid translocation permease protein TagG [Rhodoplanes serenus]